MTAAADANASGGKFVTSPAAESGSATFTINLPVAGTYILWGRVLAPSYGADSFYVSVDGGPEDVYDVAEGTWSANWQWTRVNGRGGTGKPLTLNPRTFQLSAGTHKINFRTREANSRLDKIFITGNPGARPE
jgi:hypothetical protein